MQLREHVNTNNSGLTSLCDITELHKNVTKNLVSTIAFYIEYQLKIMIRGLT